MLSTSEPANTIRLGVSEYNASTSDENLNLTEVHVDVLMSPATEIQLASIRTIIPLKTRYKQFFPDSINNKDSSHLNFMSEKIYPDVEPNAEMNLAIIPVGAIILFIIVCAVYIGRWCVDKTPTASSPAEKPYDSERAQIPSSSGQDQHELEVNGNEKKVADVVVRSTSFTQNPRGPRGKLRRHRSLNSVPVRIYNRRQLVGLTDCSSVDEERMVLARANSFKGAVSSSSRRINNNNGNSSTSSIPLTEMSDISSRCSLAAHDEPLIVERTSSDPSRSLLQRNRYCVVGTPEQAGVFRGGGGVEQTGVLRSGSDAPSRRRKRHYSSPAASAVSTRSSRVVNDRCSERTSENTENVEGQSASGSSSCCSETRPLITNSGAMTSLDVKVKAVDVTSSDSNNGTSLEVIKY